MKSNNILALAAGLIVATGCGPATTQGPQDPPPPLDQKQCGLGSSYTCQQDWNPNGTKQVPIFASKVGCVDNEFYVDVPQGGLAVEESFPTKLRIGLQQLADRRRCEWFPSEDLPPSKVGCTYNKEGCRWVQEPSNITVQVTTVFKKRTDPARSNCLLHDGHQRFFRIKFLVGGQPLVVPENAVCEVVRGIRELAEAVAVFKEPDLCNEVKGRTGRGQPFLVGRECPVHPLDVDPPDTTDGGILKWYLDRLGADSTRSNIPSANVSRSRFRPNIYMIDTGVYPDESAKLRLSGQVDVAPSTESFLHPHGTAMAMIMRQVNPSEIPVPAATRVGLRSYKVTESSKNTSGHERLTSTIGALALGIESAWFDARRSRNAAIFNISMGWPPRLSVAPGRPLCGGVLRVVDGNWQVKPCTGEREDPIGEPVRFALSLIRHELNDRAVVAAAPGNVPAPYSRIARAETPLQIDGVPIGIPQPVIAQNVATQAAGFTPPNQANPFNQPATAFQRSFRVLPLGVANLRSQGIAFFGKGEVCGETFADPLANNRNAMFYPAAWAEVRSTFNPFTRTTGSFKLTVAPGALNQQDKRVVTTRPSPARPFELPGQQVYLSIKNMGITPMANPGVPANLDEYRFRVKVPSAYSGTSVSTALFSSVAAEAQYEFIRAFGRPASWSQVLRLLTVTADPTNDARTVPSVCRLRRGMASAGACRTALQRCAGAPLVPEIWSSGTTTSFCATVATACKAAFDKCPKPTVPPYASVNLPTTARFTAPSGTRTQLDCPSNSSCLEMGAAGSLGPQPGGSICPDCPMRFNPGETAGTGTIDIFSNFEPGFEGGTTLEGITLVVIDQNGTENFFPLAATGHMGPWNPGDHIEVEVTGVNLETAQGAYLISTVDSPAATGDVAGTSPIRMVVD